MKIRISAIATLSCVIAWSKCPKASPEAADTIGCLAAEIISPPHIRIAEYDREDPG